jgi:hypothetical protein
MFLVFVTFLGFVMLLGFVMFLGYGAAAADDRVWYVMFLLGLFAAV